MLVEKMTVIEKVKNFFTRLQSGYLSYHFENLNRTYTILPAIEDNLVEKLDNFIVQLNEEKNVDKKHFKIIVRKIGIKKIIELIREYNSLLSILKGETILLANELREIAKGPMNEEIADELKLKIDKMYQILINNLSQLNFVRDINFKKLKISNGESIREAFSTCVQTIRENGEYIENTESQDYGEPERLYELEAFIKKIDHLSKRVR